MIAVIAFSSLTLANIQDDPAVIQGERALQIYQSLPGDEIPTYDPHGILPNGSYKEGNGMYCWKSVSGFAYCHAL